MKVVYPGLMTGYHVVGREATKLVPGVNEITSERLAKALLAAEIVIPIEETHFREPVNIGSPEPIDEGGRAEGSD